MTKIIDLNSVQELEDFVAEEMAKRDLFWNRRPSKSRVSAPGTPSGWIEVWDGQIVSTISGRSVLVGPYYEGLEFWTNARYIVLDTDWTCAA